VEESRNGDHDDHDELQSGEVIGSARYMSPEQIMGRQATPCSDIYSVGILLYHCLTGEPPFSGDTKSVARQQIHRDPLPPRRLNRKIPQGLEDVILKALSKEPSGRYPSAEAMLAALRKETPARFLSTAFIGRLLGDRKKSFAAAALAAVLLSGTAAAGFSGYVSGPGDLAASRSSDQGTGLPGKTEGTGQSEQKQGISVFGIGGSEETAGSGNTASGKTANGDKSSKSTSDENLVKVPNVDSYYDYYAEDVLASEGFKTKVVYEYQDGYSDRGVTWGTDPLQGKKAPEGSTITIYATPKDQPQPQF
jgi:serine/threonine-protein kinase